MTLVAGVDSSTQSVKVVVETPTPALGFARRAPHPEGTSVDPATWWSALQSVLKSDTGGFLEGVGAISVAGQQHGMVVLDGNHEVIRPALLWNDTRSAAAALDLVTEMGGPGFWADAVGSVPVAAFTVSKIRWLAQHEPENAVRVASLMLPHDYLTWLLAGRPAHATTDRGEVSGTGYWSPATGAYREDLVELALGHVPALPHVAAPNQVVGETTFGNDRSGIKIGPGTGDNMGAALALDAGPGDIVVS